MLHQVQNLKNNFNSNHKWILKQDGSVNYNYLNYEDHNGPFCKDCRRFFCMVCDDISSLQCPAIDDTNLKKNIESWSPIGGELANKIINRKGHDE